MQAAVLEKVGEPLEIQEIRVDRPGPREVLVRTAATGVCHSDLHFIQGLYPHPLPTILGHEAAGVVDAVGSSVTYVRPGDHVIACLSAFCGECSYCLGGRPALCGQRELLERDPADAPRLSRDGTPLPQFLRLSAFAEQMLIHEHALVKVRPDMPLDRAALIGCAVMTGVGAVLLTARVPAGATVAVIGCGGVGLNSVQGAALAGAGRIIAIDALPSKLDLACEFGATDVVDASAVDPVHAVRELTGGGVEYSFEAIGKKVTSEQAFRMLARGGTATLVGMIPVGTKIELHGPDFLDEKKVQGSNMGSNRFRVDMPRYVDLYLEGRLKLDELVSRTGTLHDVNDAFRAMEAGEVARTVLLYD